MKIVNQNKILWANYDKLQNKLVKKIKLSKKILYKH